MPTTLAGLLSSSSISLHADRRLHLHHPSASIPFCRLPPPPLHFLCQLSTSRTYAQSTADQISTVRAIVETMLSTGYGEECITTYQSIRRSAVTSQLKQLGGANEEKSTNCLQSVVPLESAEKPPLHILTELAKAPLSQKRGAIVKKNTNLSRKKVNFDLKAKTYKQVGERSEDEIEEETVPKSRLLLSPTCVTFPSNHCYQNCDNYDEIEEMEEEEEDEEEDFCFSDDEEVEGLNELDGVGLDEIGIRIEGNDKSYESFFSFPTDKETELLGLHTRDRSQFVYHVLNPVENISQWKRAKVNLSGKVTKRDRAMNINLYIENKGNEVSVDTSLSSWLGSTENSMVEKEQVGTFLFSWEDTILGAPTMEDFKESLVNFSPRQSQSRIPAPDDVPDDYWYSEQLLELQYSGDQ
ncbi:hypothetical protein LUZ63_010704 [Rhynchospora breviuscula]|uniref:Uncharacterized protein n=1 Tax=Rhynchospora breviuscula TaxID=2022672 RepID=A0A9Q0CHG9_9POAL|nr:hypothetical protein LUZ63_010704 [Rhynchospora breviuscula]